MSDKEAIDNFRIINQHLGVFKDEKTATTYAQNLHKDQEKEYKQKGIAAIKAYQEGLIKKGAKIKADGIWGPKTQAASNKYGPPAKAKPPTTSKSPDTSKPPATPKPTPSGQRKPAL
jgi:hypothetical protein